MRVTVRLAEITATCLVALLLLGCAAQPPRMVRTVGPDLKPAAVQRKGPVTIVNWTAHDPDASF
ncbi:MAG: hypothetical protein ACREQ4_08180 [Candidatus Binataceae bacterium]